jgi:acyl-CoA synthetase (AMP-forming)/AMP-acid ligase II
MKAGQNATEQEIIQFCKKRMAHYKAPKSIDFIETLPEPVPERSTKRV